MIRQAIEEAGSKTRAAQRLGIPRQSLQKMMKRLGLTDDPPPPAYPGRRATTRIVLCGHAVRAFLILLGLLDIVSVGIEVPANPHRLFFVLDLLFVLVDFVAELIEQTSFLQLLATDTVARPGLHFEASRRNALATVETAAVVTAADALQRLLDRRLTA